MVLHSVSGYTNGDSVFLWIDAGNASAELVWGIVNTGTISITSMVRGVIGSASAHANGAAVSQYVSSADHMSMRKGMLVQHNQDGTHKAITAPSVTTTGAVTAGSGLVMSAGAFQPTGSWDGWVAAGESWSYLSSTTITVPTDATTKYDAGDFIKITQSATVKYFQIVSLTSTILTVKGLNGVTVANSAISAPAYSKGRTPHGITFGSDSFYGAVVYNAGANTTIANSSETAVSFDQEEFDFGGFHAAGSQYITIPTGLGGVYIISATSYWDVNSTGVRYIRFTKNGSVNNAFGGSDRGTAASTQGVQLDTATAFALLAAGDYIGVNSYQTSGGNIGCYIRFSMIKVA